MRLEVWARWPRSNIISLSASQYQIFSNEGVHILPVKFEIGPHQNVCSPRESSPVKRKRASVVRRNGISVRWQRLLACMLLAIATVAAMAQGSQTIDQIRVIGNRRIPKETI